MRHVLLFALCVGCAAPPAHKPKTSVGVATTGSDETETLSLARAPDGLLLVGRLSGVQQWLRVDDTPPLLRQLAAQVLENAELAALVDFTEPIELALSWTTRGSLDRAQQEQRAGCEDDVPCEPEAASDASSLYAAISLPLVRWEPSRFESFGFVASGRQQFVRDECSLQRSLGSAPARLICGQDQGSRQALASYLARGLPLEPLSSSPLYFELRPQPLRTSWRRERADLHRELAEMSEAPSIPGVVPSEALAVSSRIAEALLSEADRFAESVRSVTLEGRPTPEDGFELSLNMTSADPQPWLMRAYAEAANTAMAPPVQFQRLPGAVHEASFTRGLLRHDSELLLDGARDAWSALEPLLAVFAGQLGGATELLSRQLDAVLASRCLAATESTSARLPYQPAPTQDGRSADNAARAWLGHYLVGVPSDAQCGKLLSTSLDSLASSPGARALLKDLGPGYAFRPARLPASLGSRAKAYELVIPRTAVEADTVSILRASRTGLPPAGDPSGEVTKAKSGLRVVLVLMPTDEGDWFGLSAAPEQLYAALAGLRTSAKQQSSGARTALAQLQRRHTIWGNLSTLRLALEELPGAYAVALKHVPAEALDASLVTTLRVSRPASTKSTVRAELETYLPPQVVSAARALLVSDPARLERLVSEFDSGLEVIHE